MPKKPRKVTKQEGETAAAEKPTQKKALAEAIRHLGPDASHAALARFVKKQFGMELTFCIVFPKTRTISEAEGSTTLQQKPSPRTKCA